MTLIKLITSPTCPHCVTAKKVLEEFSEQKDVQIIELSVTTDEGMKEAIKFGVRSVPAIVVNDKKVIVGVPSVEELAKAVEDTER
jgi:small redox-active disulfide protein 1